MSISTEEKEYSFSFKMSSHDTLDRIGFETFEKLMKKLEKKENDVIQLALMSLANQLLPHYDADADDLTDAQIQYLQSISPAKNIPEECYID